MSRAPPCSLTVHVLHATKLVAYKYFKGKDGKY